MRSWRARLRSGLRDLHPGSFAFVMATGILSTGELLFGRQLTSGALLVVAAAGYVVLCAGYALRAARYPARIWADTGKPERAFGFFTFVAGSTVLSLRLALAGQSVEPRPWPCWAGCLAAALVRYPRPGRSGQGQAAPRRGRQRQLADLGGGDAVTLDRLFGARG